MYVGGVRTDKYDVDERRDGEMRCIPKLSKYI